MNTAALRTLMVYAIVLPLAIFIGWIVSGDMTRTSFAVLASIIFALLLPVLLKWHYQFLLLSWSTSITIFFLPGRPALWMLMAGINFGIAILNRIIQKRRAFISAPSIAISLLMFLAVVVITGQLRGGFGSQALGSTSYGGKAYYAIFAAIIGYFALISRPIPQQSARRYVGMFFLPAMITAGSNLIYYAGPSFYFLFLVFPVGFAGVQAAADYSGSISRVAGFGVAGTGIVFYLLAVHGIRGVLQKWWRLLLLLAALVLGMLAGYRSFIGIIGLTVIVLFIVEGLLRSPLFPAGLLACALCYPLLNSVAPHLPASIQRTLSVLPVKIDPSVRYDAEGSTEWRLAMWRTLVPELPKYFWLGKGYSIDPTDLYLTQQAMLRHRVPNYQGALLVGDYHSGPLSVYVAFGLFGSLAFIAFLGVSLRALYLNYRNGSDELKTLNRFIFACFCGRLLFFLFAFGALSSDLYVFTGIVGLSVALNNGIANPLAAARRPVVFRGALGPGAVQTGSA